MARLLITGALGHIGSRFIHSLTPGEYEEVVLMDNLSTQRYCSLFNLPEGVRYRFVAEDICSADLKKYFQGIDAVIHFAAITDAPGSFEIEDQVERVNFDGTERVAQACLETGSALVFPSTTSVYGSQEETVSEDCAVSDLKPQSPYAVSKLKAERCLQALGTSDGMRFVVCRFGTIFGTSIGMRFHTAINKFCWQAVNGQPITVWRTAMDQNRPYLDLGDAVQALKFIIWRKLFDGRIYNVLTINASVRQIIEAISTRVPDVTVGYVDAPIMNQLSYHVLNDRFAKLGFEFKGSLEQGINDTVQLLRGVRRC